VHRTVRQKKNTRVLYKYTTNVKHEMCDDTDKYSYFEAAPGKHSTDSPENIAILGTSHIIRKVLQCET
jgi:hypothetical protein